MIDGFALAEDGVEQQGAIAVLQGAEVAMHHAHHPVLVAGHAIQPNHRFALQNRGWRMVAGLHIHFPDFPVQCAGVKRLFHRGRPGQWQAFAVPGDFTVVEHFTDVGGHG